MRHEPGQHRRHHLHQQGGPGNAGTGRPAAPGRLHRRPHHLHLPLPGRAHPAGGGQGPGLQTQVLHLRFHRLLQHLRRPLGQRGQGHHPQHPVARLRLEERHEVAGPGRRRGQERDRGPRRQGLPGLRRHPQGLPGGGFRRPDPAAHAALPGTPEDPRQVAEPPALPAGGRIPGHQRLPVPAAEAADRAPGHVHRRGRRRSGHLRLARRRRGKPAGPAAGLSQPEADHAGAELPLHRPHPAGRQQRHRQQRKAVREKAVVRPGPRRGHPRHRLPRQRARGRVGGDEAAGRQVREAQQVLRLRHPLPLQPPGPAVRNPPAQQPGALRHVRRHQLLREVRDQGRHRLPAPAGQPGRRSGLHPRRHHAQAGRRRHHPGSPANATSPSSPPPSRKASPSASATASWSPCCSSASSSTGSSSGPCGSPPAKC